MPNVIALKPYIESVEQRCDTLSKREIIDILCQVAQEVPAGERSTFLAKLGIDFDAAITVSHQDTEEIIEWAAELVEEIIERQSAIEDGSYYELYGEDDDEYYYDEDPDFISEDQKKDVKNLFKEADKLFLSGETETAENVYSELIGLFGNNSKHELYYAIYHSEISINWCETISRYYRCVYENASANERVQLMIEAMEIDTPIFEQRYAPKEDIRPGLSDVLNAKPGELDGWRSFLDGLKNELDQVAGNRSFLLYLEAVQLLDGLEAVAAAVREKKVPVGYLHLLDLLQDKASWPEMTIIAQEALENMPLNALRASAAERLHLAAEKIGDSALVLNSVRERFFSEPKESHLEPFLRAAIEQNVRSEELHAALGFMKKSSKRDSWTREADRMLKLKVRLMLGDLDNAFTAIDSKRAYGWSYGNKDTGGFYAAVLMALVKSNSNAKTIYNLFDSYIGKKSEATATIYNEILQTLSTLSFSSTKKEQWFAYLENIATARIDHIVSNKYRNAYARAAETMGGFMECMIINDREDSAKKILYVNRNQKYKRYSAFRSEVDYVLKKSPLLNRL